MTSFHNWLNRIGATQDNFSRWSVKTYDQTTGYPERSHFIKIRSDGTIDCPDHLAPELSELSSIEQELKDLVKTFPKHVYAGQQTLGLLKIDQSSQTYKFWDRKSDQLIMVQECRVLPNGKKAYIPHTFWSDGVWRQMHPTSDYLPFYKPRKSTGKPYIMVHEGAKAAEFCNNIDPQHPWREELELYEHWGMIGGAITGPLMCDMSELATAQPEDVVYICDNDAPGKRAITPFARRWRKKLRYVFFHDSWPQAWDLADPIPPNFDHREDRLLSWKMYPATWATEKVSTKPVIYDCTDKFTEEWLQIVAPELFIHADRPDELYSSAEFNNLVRPFSDVDDTARLLRKSNHKKSVGLIYNPAMPPGIFTIGTGTFANTHVPGRINAKAGDPQPWIDFMHHLIPDKQDCQEVMRWVATLIARPEIKMAYALLLISSTQGVGKSTLGSKIIAPIIGRHNVSEPSENTIVDSNFTDWMAHKRLAICHEIYAGHSAKAYNKLKSIITDDRITVNKKYLSTYTTENWLHIIACSNSERALRLENDDRRYLVPKVTEERMPHKYWIEFHQWLNKDGLNIIKYWSEEFGNYVIPGDTAPWTKRKTEVIQENYSPGQKIAAEFFDNVRSEFNGDPVLMFDNDVVDVIRDKLYDGRHNDKIEKPLTIRKIAKFKGYHCAKERIWDIRQRRFSRIITNKEELTNINAEDLKSQDNTLLNPVELARKWLSL